MKLSGHSERRKIFLSERPLLETVILCIIGSVLNFAFSQITEKVFMIPLFLDTIFSFTILFYCGLFPSICCSLLSNLPSVIMNKAPLYLLFVLCTISSLVITKCIMNINRNKKSIELTILYLILAALLSTVIASIIGGMIHSVTYIKYPILERSNVTERFILSLFSQNQNVLISAILGRIPCTCIDRVISTLVGFSLYKLIEKLNSWIKYKKEK